MRGAITRRRLGINVNPNISNKYISYKNDVYGEMQAAGQFMVKDGGNYSPFDKSPPANYSGKLLNWSKGQS